MSELTTEPTIDPRDELASLAAELRNHVLWMRDSGVKLVTRPGAPPPPMVAARSGEPAGRARPAFLDANAARPRPAPPPAPRPVTAAPIPAEARPAAPTADERALRLKQIRDELGDCRRCPLSATRRSLVFGEGNPNAELVFLGDAPGEEEDRTGLPFTGPAGDLLTKMIEAMGFTRADVYLCHLVKCRPAGEHPQAAELEHCRPFVEQQLRAIRPKVVVALGAVAVRSLLRTEGNVAALRGTWQRWEGIDVMPTFHPGRLLRVPADKRPAWEDLKLVLARLGRDAARK